MVKTTEKPECAKEALDLLNCVAQTPFDQDRCLRLMQVLRDCALNKKVKKFSLAEQQGQETNQSSKEA